MLTVAAGVLWGVLNHLLHQEQPAAWGGGSVFCNFLFLQGRKTLAVKGACKLEDARFALLRSFPVAQDVTNAL